MSDRSVLKEFFVGGLQHLDKLCISDEHADYTYDDILRLSLGFSRELSRTHHIKKGDRIVVVAEQTAPFVIANFAIQLSGAVTVPVERNIQSSRLQEILNSISAALLLSNPSFAFTPQLPLDDVLLHRYIGELDVSTVTFPASEDLSNILFTTGTTGLSKGVMLTHGNQCAIAENLIEATGISQQDVALVPLPLNHGYGYRRVYTALLAGATVVLADGVMYAGVLHRRIVKYGVTMMHFVPPYFDVLLSLLKERFTQLAGSIRLIEFGAMRTEADLWKKAHALFPQTLLINTYGCTEAPSVSFCAFSDMGELFDCIGKALQNSTMQTVDENGEPFHATQENPGYIRLGGQTLMTGYWNDPALTEKCLRGGWLLTQDLAYYDPEERLHFIGRDSDVINIAGIKVAPEEIENVAMEWAGVQNCACVVKTDPVMGCIPVLYVQMEEEAFNARDIMAFLSARLEKSCLPRRILWIDEIPVAATGKKLRKLLKER